jgi:DNA-binding SARP family transcriptional activator
MQDYRGSKVSATTIQLCGRYVAELAGERVEARLPGRQGRLLFAYLVLNRDRAVSRGELVDAVWPGELPQKPSEALAALLSKVRAGLRGEYLEGRGELRLLLPADPRIDVEQALAAVHEAESACALGEWERAWGASLCGQLVAKRPLLNDHETPWIDDWRRRLDEVLLRSLECYATACLGLGGTELAGAERSARLLVSLAPLRESASALLMDALEKQGNAGEALLVYEALRRRLRDELGVAPTERLRAVHRRLLGASGG